MMSLRAVAALLVFVCTAYSWNLDTHPRFPSAQEQPFRPTVTLNRQQCFGLSRRSRQVKINVPVLLNVRTRQVSPIPSYLYAADYHYVAKLESDGWEVRTSTVYVPHTVYERVPVCCQWDPTCEQAQSTEPQSPGQSSEPQSPAQSSEPQSPCANGGQLIYKDGQQRCECPPGFLGSFCQISDPSSENQPNSTSSMDPRNQSRAGQHPDMLREADAWRMQTLQSPVSPMLSLKDHMLTAVARPWAAYRSAALQQHQALLARMAQMEETYHQVPEWYGQAPQGMYPYNSAWGGNSYNAMDSRSGSPYAPAPNMANNPYNARRRVSAWGGNFYNTMDSRSGSPYAAVPNMANNPYNGIQPQAQLSPNMARAFYAVQQGLTQNPDLNPYSHLSQAVPNFGPMALSQRVQNEQGGVGINRYNRPQSMDLPKARTPWDLDPFGQQQNPSYMNFPGTSRAPTVDKRMMLLAFYQQLLKQQQSGLLARKNLAQNGQILGGSPLPDPVLPPQVKSGDQPAPHPAGSSQNNGIQSEKGANTNPTNLNEQNQGPINGHPAMPMPGEGPPEVMKQVERCQHILTPKMNECLKQHQVTIEQFMNPDYIAKSKAVCQASESIGQCIMQHDKVCGEGEAILMTRKIINSVLRMMGMICQQISIRGEQPITPMQGPMGQQFGPLGSAPGIQPRRSGKLLKSGPPQVKESQSIRDGPQKSDHVDSKALQEPQTSGMDSHQPGQGGAESAASKGLADPDSTHPVSEELLLFGYPLWLMIAFVVALFVVLFLLIVVICVCCRRSCRKRSFKVEKEIEKVPVPLDSKMCTIDVPPPSYTTAALQQNKDGLALPPLDLSAVDEKPPLDDDDDADDESGEKDDDVGK